MQLRPARLAFFAQVRDLGTLAIGEGVSRGIIFLTFVLLSHWMTPSAYGAINVGFALAMSLAQGPTGLDVAYVSLYHDERLDRLEVAYVYRALMTAITIAGLAAAGSLWVIANESMYGRAAAIGLGYAGVFTLFRNLPIDRQARGQFGRMAVYLALLPTALLLLTLIFRLLDGPMIHADALFIAWTSAAAFLAAYAFFSVGGAVWPMRWSRDAAQRLLRFAAWLLVSTVSFALAHRLELFIVAASTRPERVGSYAVALRYAALYEILTTALAALVLQRASASPGVSDRRLVRQLTGPAALLAGAGFAHAAIAPFLLPFMFGARYKDAVIPAIVLLIAQLPVLATVLGSGLLYRREAPAGVALASVAGLFTKVAAAVPLTRAFELIGAATSSILSSLVIAIATWWYLRSRAGLSVTA